MENVKIEAGYSVELKVHNKCKYHVGSEITERFVIDNVEAWEIVTDGRIMDIEYRLPIDEYHEYLVLYLEDGTTCTYRNSYVDMFRND